MDFLLSGITKSLSIPIIVPKPSHFVHAPCGLLKLKNCTVGSLNTIPSLSKRLLNCLVSPPNTSTTQSPSDSIKQVCTESANLPFRFLSFFNTILSTTIFISTSFFTADSSSRMF